MRVWVLALLLVTPVLAGCIGGSDTSDDPVRKAQATISGDLGGIEGVVTDPAIQPIPGANVTLVETNQTTQTRSDGSFAFSQLEPGTYTVSIQAGGFISDSRSVTVTAGNAAVLDVVLTRLFTEEPFTQQFELAGFFECGFAAGYNLSAAPPPANLSGGLISWPFCATLNAATGNATNDRFDHFFELDAPIETLIVETTWDPGAGALSDQIWVDIVPQGFHCGSITMCEWSFIDHWGPSPLTGRIDNARFQHVQDHFNEECQSGEDEWCGYNFFEDGWPLWIRVYPRWECQPAGPQACVLLQQPFDHVITGFFNAPAPEGYSALE